MTTKNEQAYINAAIPKREVAEKILDIIDWYDGFSQGSGAVDSVNGKTGIITLDTSDIPENGNLYYTESRVNNNVDPKINNLQTQINNKQDKAVAIEVTLLNNQITPVNILNIDTTQNKFAHIKYSMERNQEVRIGTIMIGASATSSTIIETSNDTHLDISEESVVLSSLKSGDSLFLRYTSNNTGHNIMFKYFLDKWF